MDINNKNILVYGLGVSGISTMKTLANYDCRLTLLEGKSKDELKEGLREVEDIDFRGIYAGDSLDLDGIDLIVKSPGIPPSNSVLLEARERQIDIITDLELGFKLSNTENIIAITGTNGKTSTTTLVGEIFRQAGNQTYVCGNIGIGILDTMAKTIAGDIVAIECSSFQLEDTIDFKPRVAILINISPDHINWHGSYENYIESKLKIYRNQDEYDLAVINYDDQLLVERTRGLRSQKLYFSTRQKLEEGVYIDQGFIVYKTGGQARKIARTKDLDIFLENALAAVAAGIFLGVEDGAIGKALEEFKALPHRMEYVTRINNIDFYNDSKGTNPDSTMAALEKIEGDITLIAGGYDKGSDFRELLTRARTRVENLILLGQTRELIYRQALELGYKNIYRLDSMEEAVAKSLELSHEGMVVLLSPACASWGMYENFEERGDHFKDLVERAKVDENAKRQAD